MIYFEFSEKNIKKITKELLFLENTFFGKNMCFISRFINFFSSWFFKLQMK